MRKDREFLKKIKKKYGVKDIFSWSKYEKSQDDLYEFYLKYVAKESEDLFDSIYGKSGGEAHDIMQDNYEGKIKYKDMLPTYKEKMLDLDIMGCVFDRADKEKNKKIKKKYIECMELFFQHHKKIPHKLICEQFMVAMVGKYLFQGYIDAIHKENGCYIITDWKTSSMYAGEKLESKKGQLLIYAIMFRNKGVPLDKIKVRWNFMKYCNVEITLAKKNEKRIRVIERNALGDKLYSNVAMWMKKLGYSEEEVEKYTVELSKENDIVVLPDDVQEKYKIDDCYVYVDFDEENLKEFEEKVNLDLDEICDKIKEYEETKDENIWWQEVTKSQSYFLRNLSGYSAKKHKPYAEYLDRYNRKSVDEDNSWLEKLF